MKKSLYLLILVGAVSLAGFVSVSGNGAPEGVSVFEAGGRTCVVFPDGSGECFCECEPSCGPNVVVPAGTPVIPATNTPDVPTATPSEESTPVIPTSTPEVEPTVKPTKQACNQGIGNGAEGCDPGNSNNNQPSNDEGGRKPGTRGPRGK